MRTKIFLIIIILTLLSSIGIIFLINNNKTVNKTPDISQVKAICDLATLETYYHNVAKYNKPAQSGINHLFEKDRKLWIEYTGTAKIGIDMSKVDMQIDGNDITVKLPKAKILSLEQAITGKMLASDIVKRSRNNCLIINKIISPTRTILDTLKSIFIDSYRFLDYYHIIDSSGKVKYKVKYHTKFKTHGLYNINNEKLGWIEIKNKEDIRDCCIYVNNNNLINLKKYKNNDDIYAATEQVNLKINYNKINAYELEYDNAKLWNIK